MTNLTRDDPGHPRSRYRAKYVILRQFFEKGLAPEDACRVLAVHPNTLRVWCDKRGIPYPAEGPEEYIETMTEADISVDHFPDDVDVPDYGTNWTVEDVRETEPDYDHVVSYRASDSSNNRSKNESNSSLNDESTDDDGGMDIEEQGGVFEW